jgi:hypothetical protein
VSCGRGDEVLVGENANGGGDEDQAAEDRPGECGPHGEPGEPRVPRERLARDARAIDAEGLRDDGEAREERERCLRNPTREGCDPRDPGGS